MDNSRIFRLRNRWVARSGVRDWPKYLARSRRKTEAGRVLGGIEDELPFLGNLDWMRIVRFTVVRGRSQYTIIQAGEGKEDRPNSS